MRNALPSANTTAVRVHISTVVLCAHLHETLFSPESFLIRFGENPCTVWDVSETFYNCSSIHGCSALCDFSCFCLSHDEKTPTNPRFAINMSAFFDGVVKRRFSRANGKEAFFDGPHGVTDRKV